MVEAGEETIMEKKIHMWNLTEIDKENLIENLIEILIGILMWLHLGRLHIEEIHMNHI